MTRLPAAGALMLVLALAVPAGTAQAQPRDPREADIKEVEAKEAQAKMACLGNRPDRGIELLAELYARTNDATYIYNQARCYQQNGRAQDAATRFREYLRKAPHVDAAERAKVQGFITELEAQARPSAAAAGPPRAPAPVSALSPGRPSPAPAATVTATPAPPATSSPAPGVSGWRVAGVVSASLGALALAGGIYMGTRARALSDEVTRDGKAGTFSQTKYDDGRRAETLQWVGLGVGAAALAGGAVLYLLGGRGDAESPGAVALLPALGSGASGAAVRVRF